MTEAGGRLGARLRRILTLVPYAVRHPGVTVDELSRKFGIPRNALMADLNLVFLCGLPGYGPGDLIDVTLEEDRVYVRMADYFAAPLRLTPAEALALYAGAEALAELPGMDDADALRRALGKVARALGLGNEAGETTGIEVALESGAAGHLETLQGALSQQRQVRLEYFSGSRAELSDRVVEPWGLVAALGYWYLVGLDHLSGEERMFRADRIKSARLLEEPAVVPDDFDPGRYRGAWRGGAGGTTMTLEVSPEVARWFEEYYPTTASKELTDGWHRYELTASSDTWAATLLLRLGRGARNVQPDAVVDAARTLAGALAARHG